MTKPTKRSVLNVLTAPRLCALTGHFDLPITARHPRVDHLEALANSQKVRFSALLAELTEDELKAICRVHQLGDACGRRADLAARILGAECSATDRCPALTLPELERHVWGAADILRGSIDSSDYKHYILGLLFYKRLNDVWVEEHEHPRGPKHRFDIPEGCFWQDVRRHRTGIGNALNTAFRAIERTNPNRLKGIFQDVDFANRERFPDHVLNALLDHFERCRLRTEDVPSTMLGDAYEYLIAQFADDAGKKGGEFYTPKQVVRLMVEVLRPEAGMTVYDPTCGSGGMLLEAAHYMQRNGHDPRALTLYGQEKNLTTWAICRMSLFIHDIDDAFIERGDTLLEPKHLASDTAVQRFDVVLANPPFSLKNWGHHRWNKGDPYARDTYGCPPKSYGDLAFVQHMVASLQPGGRMAVVVPLGVLFRGGAEGKIRAGLIKSDLIEAVVGLGPNLFYGTGIPTAVLFLRREKPAERKGKLLVVNAEKVFVPGLHQNALSDDNVATLVHAVHGFADRELLCRVVGLAELEANHFNLNLTRYVQTAPPPPPLDVRLEAAKLRALTKTRNEAENLVLGHLKELGYA